MARTGVSVSRGTHRGEVEKKRMKGAKGALEIEKWESGIEGGRVALRVGE